MYGWTSEFSAINELGKEYFNCVTKTAVFLRRWAFQATLALGLDAKSNNHTYAQEAK